jgi:hypothetical protein
MARAETRAGGAAWRRRSGQVSVGLTLTAAEALALRGLAGGLGISTAEFCRRLARWALKNSGPKDLGKIKKMVDCP